MGALLCTLGIGIVRCPRWQLFLCDAFGLLCPGSFPPDDTGIPRPMTPPTPSPVSPSIPGAGWYLGGAGLSCTNACNALGKPSCTATPMQQLITFESIWSIEDLLLNAAEISGVECPVTAASSVNAISTAGYDGTCTFYDGSNPTNDLGCDYAEDDVYRFCCCGSEQDCPTNNVPEFPTDLDTQWYLGDEFVPCAVTCLAAGDKPCTNVMVDVDTDEKVLFVSKNLASDSATTTCTIVIDEDSAAEINGVESDTPFSIDLQNNNIVCAPKTDGMASTSECTESYDEQPFCCCADAVTAATVCPTSP